MWAAIFITLLAFIVLLFMVYMQISGGKKYAPGAKRRRKMLMPFFFGRRSIFKRFKRMIAPPASNPEMQTVQS